MKTNILMVFLVALVSSVGYYLRRIHLAFLPYLPFSSIEMENFLFLKAVAEGGCRGFMKRDVLEFELKRKLLHLFFGLILISILLYSGRRNLVILLSLMLLLGSIMVVWRLQGRKIPVAGWFEETFERENVRFPGYGAFWYVAGTLLLALFIGNASENAAAILTLAAGDSAATIFGVRARHPLPYNESKTFEGSIAFFVFSLTACLFIGWMGVALAALTAFVESLPTPVDDNLAIPLVAALFFIIL